MLICANPAIVFALGIIISFYFQIINIHI